MTEIGKVIELKETEGKIRTVSKVVVLFNIADVKGEAVSLGDDVEVEYGYSHGDHPLDSSIATSVQKL